MAVIHTTVYDTILRLQVCFFTFPRLANHEHSTSTLPRSMCWLNRHRSLCRVPFTQSQF
jgi:hypothetical protein